MNRVVCHLEFKLLLIDNFQETEGSLRVTELYVARACLAAAVTEAHPVTRSSRLSHWRSSAIAQDLALRLCAAVRYNSPSPSMLCTCGSYFPSVVIKSKLRCFLASSKAAPNFCAFRFCRDDSRASAAITWLS